MTEVILGAGPLGVSLAQMLRADGRDAVLYSIMDNPDYDMPGTAPEQIDGSSVDELSSACSGTEVIYLCLNAHYVDWYEQFPARLRAAIDTAQAVDATLIYHDNLYMYEPGSRPFTEETPHSSTSRKGVLRADMARTFLQAVNAGRIRGAIGRSADMFGPGALNSSFNSTLGQRHFYPLLAGKAVNVVGDIDQPHTYTCVDDVARGLITLAHNKSALGKPWHLPAATTLTHRELLTLAFDIAGMRPKIRGSKVSGFVMRVIGRFQSDVGEVAEILDQFERPVIASHDAFAAEFGGHPTPHRNALETTLAWYRDNPLP